jgi:hypothetical protein
VLRIGLIDEWHVDFGTPFRYSRACSAACSSYDCMQAKASVLLKDYARSLSLKESFYLNSIGERIYKEHS